MIQDMQIILASQSPRRKAYMEQLFGVDGFMAVSSDISEPFDDSLSFIENAEALALAKAKHVQEKYPDALIIASDFIAEVEGRLFAKAESAEEAEEMLRAQLGKKQTDVAALAVLSPSKQILTHATTELYFKPADDPEVELIIRDWVKSGKWQGYAAAFAIQEETGRLVKDIKGDIENVIGFPVQKLREVLTNVFDFDASSIAMTTPEVIKYLA